MTKNISESVRSRLKNIAVKEGSDFNAVLTRYGLGYLPSTPENWMNPFNIFIYQ